MEKIGTGREDSNQGVGGTLIRIGNLRAHRFFLVLVNGQGGGFSQSSMAKAGVALNKKIKDYATKNGFVFPDYFSLMADERHGLKAGLGDDGVHPNLAGYKIMEPLVEKAIKEALKKK